MSRKTKTSSIFQSERERARAEKKIWRLEKVNFIFYDSKCFVCHSKRARVSERERRIKAHNSTLDNLSPNRCSAGTRRDPNLHRFSKDLN